MDEFERLGSKKQGWGCVQYCLNYPKLLYPGGASTQVMSSNAQAAPTEPIQMTDEDDLDDAVASYDVVLVDFYADWCGPCKMMEPSIEAIANDTDAAVMKVDVDQFQGLASQYSVQGIPTTFVFADGQQVERLVGMQSGEQLSSVVEKYAE